MPVVTVKRGGVRAALRQVPTDTTATVLPMTFDRVGQECPENEEPIKVSSLAEAFAAFRPALHFTTEKFTTQIGGRTTQFTADLEFRSLKDFDPKQIRTREPGKRNDIADLQSRIDMLHRMRERFATLPVKRAWDNEDQRQEIIQAVREFEDQLRRIAGVGGGEA